MKKYSLYILILFLISFFSACVDESLNDSNQISGDIKVRIFATTPDLLDNTIETRASYDGPFENEGKVNSLAVMVFKDGTDDAELLQLETVSRNGNTNYNGTVTLTAQQNVYIRLVANTNLAGISKGQTWSQIRSSLTYTVDNSASQAFPMTAEVGVTNINSDTTIGTSTEPKKLTRTMAKMTINVTGEGNFVYQGNKVFKIADRGFVFAQTEPDDLSYPTGVEYKDEIGSYNKNTVSYSPARKNTGNDLKTPLDNRTFIIIKGTYEGVESYYRVDFGAFGKDGKMSYVDFQRNHNYLLSVNIKTYGYATEELAQHSPINRDMVEVSITESSAYEFMIDESGHFLGVSNSIAIIRGKEEYVLNGFSGDPESYEYVLATITNEKTSGWNKDDIEIISSGDLGDANVRVELVDKYDEDGNLIPGMKEYLLLGKIDNLLLHESHPPTTTLLIRYGRLVKPITVLRGDFVDSHYERLEYTFPTLRATVKKHRHADGSFFNSNLNWIYFSINDGDNSSSYIPTDADQNLINGYGDQLFVNVKEHVDVNAMGVFASRNNSESAKYEGFRFADLYLTNEDLTTAKYIVAQANSDLVGYFGSTHFRNDEGSYIIEQDNGSLYDSYLVVERITDDYTTTSTNLIKTCNNSSPSDRLKLWYLPTSRQLMGIWLSNNSDSRKTRTMYEAGGSSAINPPYPYMSRMNYTQDQINYYETTKNFGSEANSDTNPLNNPKQMSALNFQFGETTRYMFEANTGSKIPTRCVRNLTYEELPDEVKARLDAAGRSPVKDKQVTMDPGGFLSDDYFRQDVDNPIARKIEVLPKTTETDNTTVYKWTNTGWSQYVKGGLTGTLINTWTIYPGWQRNGKDLYTKDRGNSYVGVLSNNENVVPEYKIEKEYTLNEAWNKSIADGGRLPSQRELMMLYVYYPLLINGGMDPFYKDEADGYYETGDSYTPNRMLYQMYRYPLEGSIPYLHWYWTSTTRSGQFDGNDNGSVIPQRINFHFGDVNARGATETTARDHYRAVKTVE